MTQIPPALAALAGINQFILYITAPDKKPGKLKKLPVNPHTLEVVSAHDPQHWVTLGDAWSMVSCLGKSYGIGMVLTERDPYFAVDLDSCFDPATNTWTRLALEVFAMFPTAWVELSLSGRGAHIIGRGQCPLHKTKYAGPDGAIELYTKDRFIALTGINAGGNPDSDHTGALHAMVARWFTPTAGDAVDVEWRDEPVPEWCGTDDDAELIERALRSSSGASAFGRKASFKQLWEADVDALGRVFPDPSREYDASSADAALAQHLAFWTGKNHERMDRLMRQSALVRDKWDREDYLPRTIKGAVSMQKDVYVSRSLAPAGGPGPEGKVVEGEVLRDGFQFMSATQQVEHFHGCCYIRDLHKVFVPDGGLLKSEQFNATYGGYTFAMDSSNIKTTKSAWEVFTESQALRFPKVTSLCFRPDMPPGAVCEHEGRTLLNTYVPVHTDARQGDTGPFHAFMAKLLPDPRDRMLLWCYMAAVIQYPGHKFQWWPFLQGVEGNGKTLIFRVVEHCVGQRYTHYPNASDIANAFNGWIYGKIFIAIEDIKVRGKNDVMEALKPMVTNDRIDVQYKGKDQVTLDNCANGMASSNYKDGVLIGIDTRRFAPFFTAQQTENDLQRDGMIGDYFPRLRYWLKQEGYAYLNHELRAFAIPDDMNPARLSTRAPKTSSTRESVEVSRGAAEQEVIDAIEQELVGFRGGWVSSISLNLLLERKGFAKAVPPTARRAFMQALGYDWVKLFEGARGRASSAIMQEGGRPVLYLSKAAPQPFHDGAGAVHAYVVAQGYA